MMMSPVRISRNPASFGKIYPQPHDVRLDAIVSSPSSVRSV